MAVTVSGLGRVAFGALFTSGHPNMSLAISVQPNALPTSGVNTRLVSCWGDDGVFEQAFTLGAVNDGTGARLYMAIKAGGSDYDIQQTTPGIPLTVGVLVRIVSRFASSSVPQLWVDGVQLSTTTRVSSGTPPTIAGASTRPIEVGAESDESINGLDAQYGELAIWYEAVPDWVCIGYGKGMSPRYYRSGGALYCPMYSTGFLVDEWASGHGTNISGTTAVAPPMYYP